MYIIITICFDECFLFHMITGKNYFLYKFIVTQRFGETAVAVFFEISFFLLFQFFECSKFCFINGIIKTWKLKSPLEACFLLRARVKFLWRLSVLTNCFKQVRTKTQSTWHMLLCKQWLCNAKTFIKLTSNST